MSGVFIAVRIPGNGSKIGEFEKASLFHLCPKIQDVAYPVDSVDNCDNNTEVQYPSAVDIE